ncbi:MAG: hypothetical protein E7363_02155 [Clostridiales bacterium]|nr:hypothetical protein [Clostridiales bacterium]
MKNPYEVLGVNKDDSMEAITAKYQKLKTVYGEARFSAGEEGNRAARRLTEIEAAYADIRAERSYQDSTSASSAEASGDFAGVEAAIRSGDLEKAQLLLDVVTDRTAEWHYLQSYVYYRKNWMNESKKQLEIAVSMDGANPKYQKALQDLNRKMQMDQQRVFTSGNAAYGGQPYGANNGQMGGDTLSNCCTTYLCCQALSCFCR